MLSVQINYTKLCLIKRNILVWVNPKDPESSGTQWAS